MSCNNSIAHCDFCGNPTRREPVDGERLCWKCHQDDLRRAADRRRIKWERAVEEAARLVETWIPGLNGRVEKAMEIVRAGGVRRNGTAAFVRSQADPDRWYLVDRSGCRCPDYLYRQAEQGAPCKHMIAASIVQVADALARS